MLYPPSRGPARRRCGTWTNPAETSAGVCLLLDRGALSRSQFSLAASPSRLLDENNIGITNSSGARSKRAIMLLIDITNAVQKILQNECKYFLSGSC